MLRPSKEETHGIKQPPKTKRPPKPPSQNGDKQELISKIAMWRSELERQNASQGIMSVFDSICVYLGEQQRKS